MSSHRLPEPTRRNSERSLLRSLQINNFLNPPPVALELGRMLQSATRLIFGTTPTEKVKKWQTQLKKESRVLSREIAALERETAKVKGEVKKLATKGEMKNAKLLAREVVRSNKQRERLFTSQARLNSINMQLTHQLGQFPPRFSRFDRLLIWRFRHSDAQDYRNATEVDRDYETHQLTRQTTGTIANDARTLSGNDESASPLSLSSPPLPSFTPLYPLSRPPSFCDASPSTEED